MKSPLPNMLEFSEDDPLWVCRAGPDALVNLPAAIFKWNKDHGKEEWNIPGTADELSVMGIRLEGEPRGAFVDNHFLVSGINTTNFVDAIVAPGVGAAESVDVPFISLDLEATRIKELEKAEELLKETADIDGKQFLEQMSTRRLHVTTLTEENLQYVHFPIWLPSDAPDGASDAEMIAQKRAYVNYAFGQNLKDKKFLPGILKSIVERISGLKSLAAEEHFQVRSYQFDGERFNPTAATLKIDDLAFCNCGSDSRRSDLLRGPIEMNLEEACEMFVCEWVNGQQVCRGDKLKAY